MTAPAGGGARAGRLRIVLIAVVLVLAAAFITVGVAGGEPLDVLARGVRVCLECIGIA